jgi:fatty-acyl-CoA synthase
VTEDDLRDWAGDRVPDRTAAPKTVTILDELPVTAVGKLYKLALRKDAARAELRAALDEIAGVQDIEAAIEGSSIVATVTIHPSAQEEAVKAILGRYAMEWRLVIGS